MFDYFLLFGLVYYLLYNNTPSNTIVNAVSNIQSAARGRYCRPMLQVDVFAVLFMNNLSNVVIGKVCQMVHKQNCFHNLFHYSINYNFINVQVRNIDAHLGLHPSSHAEKETRYI